MKAFLKDLEAKHKQRYNSLKFMFDFANDENLILLLPSLESFSRLSKMDKDDIASLTPEEKKLWKLYLKHDKIQWELNKR